MTGRIGLFLVCAAAIATTAEAQVLTLDAAVAEARLQNPELRRARAETDRAAAETDLARASRLPRVLFSESWQRSDHPVFAFSSLLSARRFTAADFAVDRLNHPGGIAWLTSRVTATHVLFDAGRRSAAIDASRAAHDAASARVSAAEADLALDVTRTYGRILIARASERSAEAALKAAEEDLARAERRRAVGLVTDADVLALSVQRADLEQQRLQARGDASIAMAELNRLRGAAIDEAFDVADIDPAADAPETLDLARLFATAEASRAAIRAADAELGAAEARVTEASRGWLPVVSAQVGYERNGLSFGARDGAWTIGGDLQWSLSLGREELARVRAAGAAVQAARASADGARASVRVDVLTAVRLIETAQARAAAAEEAVRQAQESQRILRNRYEAGVTGLAEMLRAVGAALDAERTRVAARVDVLVARAQLQRATGAAPRTISQ